MPTIHLSIASLTGLIVLYADEQAALWVFGKKQLMDAKRVSQLNAAVSIGLALLIITGGYLYYDSAAAYLSTSAFVVKMAAVLALILNSFAIERLSKVGVTRTFASLTTQERWPLYISGAVSFIGWVTAFVCGLLIA